MSSDPNVASVLANLRRSVQGTAKHYIRLIWGEQGPPCALRLAALEDLARQIGDLLARELVEQTIDRQAFAPFQGDTPVVAGTTKGPSDRTLVASRSSAARGVGGRGGAGRWGNPTAPADLAATVYHCLGVEPHL
jgi:hypothetical protein